MTIRRVPMVAIAALALAGCAIDEGELPLAGSEAPLIGGTETEAGEDEAVVALTSNNYPICTGTLVSPSVVLTAAHCVEMGGDRTVHFGPDVNAPGRKIQVSATTTHPDWTGALGNNDIGLLLLAVPQDPELPIPLNRSPATEHVGDPYRVIGFGAYQVNPQENDGKKRQGTSTITGINGGDTLSTGDDLIRVCFGDSGGPGMLTIDGVEHVAGVHSYTQSSSCLPPMGDTRVDMHADSFVQPYIDEHDPACKRDGVCARIGCVDDPDCEPCGPDGTCVSDCELPDWDCPTQELGEVCQADTQCTTGLCVYWQAQPETKFCTKECSGNGDCPDGMACVDRPDVGSVCYFDGEHEPPGLVGSACTGHADCGSLLCEDGICTTECDVVNTVLCPFDFVCENRTGDGFRCYAEERGSGGCRTAPGGAPAWPALALIALALTRRRRGRRRSA